MLLKFIAIGVILTVGVFLIAFLEEKLVSGPRRRELERRAKEKLGAKARD